MLPMRPERFLHRQPYGGFTLIEVMIVVGIIALLVSLATMSYSYFMTKAKAVEGELVVHEIERLEYLHYTAYYTYSDNLTELGFSVSGSLKYYQPEVRVGAATTSINYQVRAVPMGAASNQAWLLTSFRDGSLLIDRAPVNEIGLFASARYAGTTVSTLTSSEAMNVYANAGGGSLIEPEWNTLGSSQGCQECGRVVINQRATR